MLPGRSKRIIEYALPAIVAGALFLVILAVGGFWPFGKESIDYYDMAQQAEAYYYHNFDQLRGLKSFVFDWYTTLGRGIPGLSEPSVYDLLLFIIPRDHILEAMSLMMMVKIMAAAFFMGIFLKYVNGEMPFVFRLMISSGYGLCGFILANYTIPQWVDMASFVPLVLMFSQKALKDGKIPGLSLSVFAISIIDTYFSIQMTMLIFFIGGSYLILRYFQRRKSEDGTTLHIFRFALGIGLGIALSSFSFLPDVILSLSSARFGNGSEDAGLFENYLTILRTVQPAYLSRWFALLSLGFPTALTVTGLFQKMKKKQFGSVLFCIACIFFPAAQLFLENTHLILHFGSYVNYPMRNSYMIYCVVAGIAAALYNGDDEQAEKEKDCRAWMFILAAAASVLLSFGFARIYALKAGVTDHDVLIFTMGFMAACCIVHMVLIRSKKELPVSVSFGLWATELLVFGILMIGKPAYATPYGNDPEQEGEYIRITDQLVSGPDEGFATGDKAVTCRIKNPDTSLNTNYGMIMQRETLAGWTGYATSELIRGATDLGYSGQFTRLLDSGGNIFSDTMLHITDVIGCEEADEKLYEPITSTTVITDHLTGEKDEYYLSKNRFTLPFAIPVEDIGAIKASQSDIVGTMNSYAKGFGAGEDIASYVSRDISEKEDNGHIITASDVKVSGKKALYLVGNRIDCEDGNTKITVNGQVIKIPTIKETDNEMFPAHFNNNSVSLGSFEDEDVEVSVDTDMNISDSKADLRIYAIDIDVLKALCDDMPEGINISQGKRSLDITVNDLPDKYKGVLIPVPYSDGWTVTVNGSEQSIESVNGLFMYVPLTEKNSVIYMSYFPKYMKTGMVIAFIAAAAIIFIVIRDRKKMPATGALDRIFGALYAVDFIMMIAFVYLIPLGYALISRVG